MPIAVQRKRTRGYRLPPNTKSVTRPGPYGNPYKIGDRFPERLSVYKWYGDGTITADNCIPAFEAYAENRVLSEPEWLEPLRGFNLACFCPLDAPCHRNPLLILANL